MFTKARLVIWVVANYDEIFEANGALGAPRILRRRWIEKIVHRSVFRSADLVAGGNKNNLQFALNNGASLDKSTIFTNGKLIHQQHLLERGLREKDALFVTSPAKYHFIYVGRLLDVKFPDDVLLEFNLICKVVPECALIMAGEGPMREDLKKMTLEMQIESKVHLMGNINQNKLANLLAGCFAVLSPLTGRSLVEAALAGLPIVAYDRDWQLDFVGNNGAGIVVPFRDWQKMGEAAISLIKDPQLSSKMGISSRKTGLGFVDTKEIYAHEQRS